MTRVGGSPPVGMWFGAHVSAAGGIENAPRNARAIGADCFALFLKNQRRWEAPPISEESVRKFSAALEECGYAPRQVLPHDAYLINMGSPDRPVRQASRKAFLDEMGRCERLGLPMLNFHPGSHKGLMGDRECLAMVADGINEALSRTRGVAAVIENTAGQGDGVGWSFEHLALLVEGVEDGRRVGVCLDTCHLFAAGYDLATEAGYEATFREFGEVVGWPLLRAMHLNDAKGPLGCRVDRHASLGEGTLGWSTFGRLARDPRLAGIPLVLETPNPDRWAREISRLRRLSREGAAT